MSQGDLFGSEPPWSRLGTSQAAAQSVRGAAATLRGRILRLAIHRGLQGLTSYEAEEILGLSNENGVHPRFWELETLKQSKAARLVRLTVPRQLFVVDKSIATRAITRPSGKSKRGQQVYFAFAAVSLEQVCAHYGITLLYS